MLLISLMELSPVANNYGDILMSGYIGGFKKGLSATCPEAENYGAVPACKIAIFQRHNLDR